MKRLASANSYLPAAEINKRLRGRRIVKVLQRPFDDDRGGKATDPMIVLDDGSHIAFVVQETDSSEYGVKIVLSDPPSTRATSKP